MIILLVASILKYHITRQSCNESNKKRRNQKDAIRLYN